MTSEPATGLAIGARIGARFEVLEEHEGGAPARAFLGVDRESERKVILVEVGAVHADALERVIGLEHRHLARVLAVEEFAGVLLLIAEHPEGLSLEQRLTVVPKKAAVDAVRLVLRLADALAAIHERGGVHGLISALSVVVAPDNGPRPVLGFAPGAAAALRAPGSSIEEPTAADDTWAAAAILHWMISGHAPPELGFADEAAVRSAGIDDETLVRVLYRALARDAEQRHPELKVMRRELARWFVAHAGEDSPGSSVRPPPSQPPPLPPAHSGVVRKARKQPSGPILALTLSAVGVGLVGGWGLSVLRGENPAPVASARSSATASGPSPISLSEVPVTGDSARLQGDKLLACVAGYLPPETSAGRANVSGGRYPATHARSLSPCRRALSPVTGTSES
ncbi:MAG TPA: hypothetical protein VM686_13290, partial [Polyangiaceae bacterium]|nr:hypothetical protein [Polyangiaceae bacterium]